MDLKRWLYDSKHSTDTKQSTSTPCNLKAILQTIIVNFSLQARSLVSVYGPLVDPEGGRQGGGLNVFYVEVAAPCVMGNKTCSLSLACLRYFYKRLPSFFNASITGWSGPNPVANRKSLLILVFPREFLSIPTVFLVALPQSLQLHCLPLNIFKIYEMGSFGSLKFIFTVKAVGGFLQLGTGHCSTSITYMRRYCILKCVIINENLTV